MRGSHLCRMLRHSFLTMLKDDFGVRMVGDPQSYFDMPLTNQIDLGQGNTVMPYVVNKMANLRVMTKFNFNSHKDPGDDSSLIMVPILLGVKFNFLLY